MRVGDFCRYGEDPSPGWLRIGTVEEIGLISTRLVRAALGELPLAYPRVTDDPARVRVSDYGPSSIDVDIFAYVGTADWKDFLAVKEDLVMWIMDIVREAGTALALPPRILYHRRDSGPDSEQEKAAERQLREWGEAHTLPFPDFSEDYREQITDTLDYPPKVLPTTSHALVCRNRSKSCTARSPALTLRVTSELAFSLPDTAAHGERPRPPGEYPT